MKMAACALRIKCCVLESCCSFDGSFPSWLTVAFQNRPEISSWRKQGWIPRRTISWWKASLPPQKESWAFFWTFSFYFLSFNGVFLSLKCRTLILKHLHGDRATAICWKCVSVTRVSKYGKSEYSRALNASYTFQTLMSFSLYIVKTRSLPESIMDP